MLEETLLREEVSGMINRLYARDLVSSVGGNVSVISRSGNYILITPTGLDKMNVKPEDIVKVGLDGTVLDNGVPSSETIVHISLYNRRNDISAVVHAHPSTAVGLVSAGFVPRGITPEFVVMIGELAVVDFTEPGAKTAEALANALTNHNLALLKNHGAFSIGNSLMQAFSRIEVLEEASKMVVAGKNFGGMPEFTPQQTQDIINKYVKKL
ncbi:MAG: class II aldolase/adducin family protein [Caldisericaceae bacterium]